jgi:hypothetical protein
MGRLNRRAMDPSSGSLLGGMPSNLTANLPTKPWPWSPWRYCAVSPQRSHDAPFDLLGCDIWHTPTETTKTSHGR